MCVFLRLKKHWGDFYPVKMNYLNYGIFIFSSTNTCNTWKTNTITDQPKAFSLHLPSTTPDLPVLDTLQFFPSSCKVASSSCSPEASHAHCSNTSFPWAVSHQHEWRLLPEHHSVLGSCCSLSYWATLTQASVDSLCHRNATQHTVGTSVTWIKG